jgi:L-ascorbate metabolism protein UlaG (beta-lactamase superfamily)
MSALKSGYGRFFLLFITAAFAMGLTVRGAGAVTASRCIAMAKAAPGVQYVALNSAALTKDEVSITFVGHATFRIESSGGVVIATDYTGYAGKGRVPDVVTMNYAHTSHYTNYPDPAIKHVLRGWGEDGGRAEHNLTVGDVLIRNVATDIRGWGDAVRRKDGNSIFIFEIAGLCIGHLGHLHHTLGPEYLGLIGQLDVVMVPVDGAYTMDQAAMVEVLKLLKARLILPMHYFGHATLSRFLSYLDESFDVDISKTATITVSVATLPANPKVLALPGIEWSDPAD